MMALKPHKPAGGGGEGRGGEGRGGEGGGGEDYLLVFSHDCSSQTTAKGTNLKETAGKEGFP